MFETLHLNTVVNSALIYLFIILGIRLLGKKELGNLSVTDLIFIMLVSEAVGEAMLASNDTLLGGIVAAGTLMVVNKILKLFVYKSKKFGDFMEGRPAILIRNGQMNRKEMKKNKINAEELEKAGREQGIGDISTISIAILEVDGKISILSDDNLKTTSNMEE